MVYYLANVSKLCVRFRLVSTLSRERQLALEEADGSHFVQSYEMILPSDNEEIMVCRDEAELNRRSRKGENDRGMIAWEMELYTPDAPTGRKIIVISNDITFQMGSFSMREHKLYQKVGFYYNVADFLVLSILFLQIRNTEISYCAHFLSVLIANAF